jgi:PKHD-type hydroxylase
VESRAPAHRALLFDLDSSIQRLASCEHAQSAPVKQSSVQLTGVYHNLLRQWAEM